MIYDDPLDAVDAIYLSLMSYHSIITYHDDHYDAVVGHDEDGMVDDAALYDDIPWINGRPAGQ